jgi:hypothetical protein
MIYTVVAIVPTGIGAAIGGYAGDAIPIARGIAAACDRLITHPNVLNGAQLSWPMANVYYVEGYGLDRFVAGEWGLRPVKRNRIGLILDRAIEPELRWRHLQAADAVRASLGISVAKVVDTDTELGIELRTAASGASWGTIAEMDSLLRAAKSLIDTGEVDAIAVVARFPDDPGAEVLQNYRHGNGVDPLAGAEAVISHAIVREFRIPCAHAPALSPLPLDPQISPRSAAEELGYTFLPCVLTGLSRAPRFITRDVRPIPGDIWVDELDAAIVPATACGGSAILNAAARGVKIITVAENTTRMKVTAADLGIEAIAVDSYLAAIGTIVADRAGIDLGCFQPDISPLIPADA